MNSLRNIILSFSTFIESRSSLFFLLVAFFVLLLAAETLIKNTLVAL